MAATRRGNEQGWLLTRRKEGSQGWLLTRHKKAAKDGCDETRERAGMAADETQGGQPRMAADETRERAGMAAMRRKEGRQGWLQTG